VSGDRAAGYNGGVDLAQVADELYALDPAEFTAGRDERARQARAAGDKSFSDAIKKLRRPTVSASLVNRLVRDAADQVGELLDLGDSLREAQEALAGDELRSLSARRRPMINALAQEAKRLAAEAGRTVSDQVEREVEATLEAVLADPAAADALRSGRLTTALSYAGFGSVDVTDAVALPDAEVTAGRRAGASQPSRPSGRSRGQARAARRRAESGAAWQREEAAAERKRREAEALAQDMREAQEVARGAVDALSEAEARVTQLRARRQAAARRIEELDRQLELAQEQDADAARALRDAERSRDAAARLASEAQRHFDRIRAKAEKALQRDTS
jgi:hypothetical protein